jgi:hypothetical protein
MDSDNTKTRDRGRPEFETTRTCELLSRLAEEADGAESREASVSKDPDSATEKSGKANRDSY